MLTPSLVASSLSSALSTATSSSTATSFSTNAVITSANNNSNMVLSTFANVAASAAAAAAAGTSSSSSSSSLSALASTVGPVVVEACSTIAPFASIFLFTAPWPTIRSLSPSDGGGGGGVGVGDLPLLPYSSMVSSAFLWTVYGLVVGNPNIWTSNGIGVVLGTWYMAQFIRCLPRPQLLFKSSTLPGSVKQHIGATVAIVTSVVAIIKLLPIVGVGVGVGVGKNFMASPVQVAQNVIGPIGIALTVGMFASPLSAIRTVVETKSASSIPLPFTVASLINCFCWTTAGVFKYKDPNIVVPNSLGLLCSMIQAALKIIYRDNNKDNTLPDGVVVRGGGGGAGGGGVGLDADQALPGMPYLPM